MVQEEEEEKGWWGGGEGELLAVEPKV